MADSNLSVKISADVASLQAGLALAQSELRSFNASMKTMADQATMGGAAVKAEVLPQMEALAALSLQAKGRISELKDELSGAGSTGFAAGISQIGNSLQGITSFLPQVAAAFAAMFAVDKIESFINTFADLGAEAEHTSHMLGMTTEAVSTLSVAFDAMGVDGNKGDMMLTRLERSMAQASAGSGTALRAFQALGVSAQQIADNLNNPEAMLNIIADRFAETADGATKTEIAMALMGRGGAQMIAFLDRGSAGLAQFNQIAQETGTVISGPMASGMEETSIASSKLGDAIKGIGISLFEALKPAIDLTISGLTNFIESMNDSIKTGGVLNRVLAGIVTAVDAVAAAFTFVADTAKSAWDVIKQFAESIGASFRYIGQAAKDLATLDFSGLTSDYEAMQRKLEEIDTAHAASRLGIWKGFSADMEALYANLRKVMSLDVSGGEAGHHPDEGGALPQLPAMETKAGGASDAMAQWREELQQKIQEQIGFFGESTALEVSYWQNILATEKMSTKESLEVHRALFEAQKKAATQSLADYLSNIKEQQAADGNNFAAKLALEDAFIAHLKAINATETSDYRAAVTERANLLREEKAQEASISDANLATDYAIQKQGFDQQKTLLQAGLSAKLITNVQESAALRQLYNEEYAAAVAYYTQKAALDQADVTKVAADYNQIRLAFANLQTQLVGLQAASLKQQSSGWADLVNQVNSDIDTMVDSVLRGTQTMWQAFGRFLGDMILSFAKDILKMTIEWAAFAAGIKGIQNPFAVGAPGLGGIIGGIGGGAGAAAAGGAQALQTSMQTLTTAVTGGTAVTQTAATATTVLGAATQVQTPTTTSLIGTLTAMMTSLAALTTGILSNTTALLANTAALGTSGAGGLAGGALKIIGLETGGTVLTPGYAYVHAGETVMSATATRATVGGPGIAGGGGMTVNFYAEVKAWDGTDAVSKLRQHGRALAGIVAQHFQLNPSDRPSF